MTLEEALAKITELENKNKELENSLNEKDSTIATLNDSANKLNKDVEGYQTRIAKLQQLNKELSLSNVDSESSKEDKRVSDAMTKLINRK